ncbi:MAG: hypothetical protein SFY96_07015 [Planctomycetota bacterium]|nr:hypothetical protein [Planctomycetota bacterium]
MKHGSNNPSQRGGSRQIATGTSLLRSTVLHAAIASAVLVPMTLVGCAGGTRTTASSAAPTADAIATLKAMAEEQRSKPATAALALPAAPGIDTDAVQVLDESQRQPGSQATMSLDEAIASATKEFVVETAPPRTPDQEPDLDAQADASRLYVRASQKLADNKFEDALNDLMQAKSLDAQSPQVWRGIGDVYAAAGRRPSALGAWQQAIRFGSREARLFAALGREALRSRRLDTAVGLLHAARNCPDVGDDAGLQWIITADLGEALADLGYLDAARRLLAGMQGMPAQFTQATAFRNELADLYRRRAELLQRAGDLSLRLGRPEDAAEAYRAAAMWDSIDPGAVLLRRVDTLARLGRPAEGSLVLLDDIVRVKGQLDERQLGLIRWLSRLDEIAQPLSDALAQVQKSYGASWPASAKARLLRARAAALEGDAARQVLREHLTAAPTDTDALSELLARIGGETKEPTAQQAQQRAAELGTLAEARPDLAELYSETLIAEGVDLLRSIGALESDNRRTSRLVAAHALQKLGLADRAWANVEAAGVATADAAADRTELATKLGRYAEAAAALNQIPSDAAYPRARALRALQRYADAAAALAPVVTSDAATVPQLMLAAELALRGGNAERTERFLRAVLAKEPANEQAAQSLVSVYSPPSPLASDEKLAALIRGIREAEPSSRVIRELAARELLRAGLWSQAETAFVSIAEQGTPAPDDVDALVTAWERQAATEQNAGHTASNATLERAARWLERKLASHPESPWLLAGLARVQTASGDAAKAEAALADRLKTMPIPDLARLRERIIREGLNRPEDADEMALQRLAAMPPTIDAGIERAEALVRAGRGGEAADALGRSLPADIALSAEQSQRISALVSRAAQDELKPDAGTGTRALALMDLAAARGIPLAPSLQDVRLALLARQRPDDRAAIAETVKAIGASDENRAEAGVRRAAQTLFSSGDRANTLRLLVAAFPSLTTPARELTDLAVALTGQFGTAPDGIDLAASIGESRLLTFVQSNAALGGLENISPSGARVEFFHALGNYATSAGRDEAAEGFYREALKIDPTHAMTNNNLGYFLLDAGRKLDDAALFIERAYRSEPSAANIMDSLAWLRYKQGVINDRVDASGKVILEGALSLLLRATDLEGDTNEEMLDHLGDAYFKAGKPDDARMRWKQALDLLHGQIDLVESQLRENAARRSGAPTPAPSSPALDRLKARVDSINAKLTALSLSKAPPVADSGVIPAPPEGYVFP